MWFLNEINPDKGGEFEKLMMLFDLLPVGVSVLNAERKLIYSNRTLEKILGYQPSPLVALENTSEKYIHADGSDMPISEFASYRVFEEKKPVSGVVHGIVKKDNSVVWVRVNAIPIDFLDWKVLVVTEDITEAKNKEEALREKNKEIDAVYKTSSDAVMRLSPPDWKFTGVNDATLRVFGVDSEEQFLGRSPWEFSPKFQPDGALSSDKAKLMIEKALKEGSNSFDWKHKKIQGQEFDATINLVKIGEGDKVSVRAVVRDVSQEKQERDRLRRFVEQTKSKLYSVTQATGNEVLSEKADKGEDTSYLLSVMDNMVDILNARNIYLENVRKAMFSLAEDLSTEKKKLMHSNSEIEIIIKSIDEAIVVVNDKGVVTLFNPAAEKISGYKKEEVLGKVCGGILKFYDDSSETSPSNFINQTISTGKITKLGVNALLERKDGKKIAVTDGVSPLIGSQGEIKGCVIAFSDSSKQREVDKAKTEFVSLASHQLRTPISAESWFIEMLLSGEVGELNLKQKDYLSEVSYLNRRLGSIVSMLLNVSRIEMGTFIVDPIPVEIRNVVEDCASAVKLALAKKNLTLEIKIADDLPHINADQKLLSIVIDNLLSNSISYTLQNGKITLSALKNEKEIIIEVSDTGIGIPEKDQEKMFTKLFRADNAKEINTDGNGIGLYMIKSIVEKWNGVIGFLSPLATETKPDGTLKKSGTKFYFTVPLSGMQKKEGIVELLKK